MKSCKIHETKIAIQILFKCIKIIKHEERLRIWYCLIISNFEMIIISINLSQAVLYYWTDLLMFTNVLFRMFAFVVISILYVIFLIYGSPCTCIDMLLGFRKWMGRYSLLVSERVLYTISITSSTMLHRTHLWKW